ncbi:glycoside hydrolase family 38 C-terminal domain-containing protein [Listeria ilorinensis]|uniref:glycoside hydrolase family 38 N-terminal domain-containing protein n=1 Tax=Listeria ilorinensis TaxID=2867439 RepID=UPI001EF478D6|nr:glycoside hydrolase family 38 C-terminal domain-containing protein [Listeria ilorinensis]
MKRDIVVHVVPHAHWDREWYFSLEDSNVLLAENMSFLIDLLENDPEFPAFVFDGQMSVVEEYLTYVPENRVRLQKLIEKKRIFVGPWYTQSDTMLVNKESLIRNLLYGTNLARKMGHNMDIGYLPDVFGQNQYLPSIFRSFGISQIVFQRGVYTDQLNNNLDFNWQAADGTALPTNNLYFGYGPGKFLASDGDYIERSLLPILDKLSAMSGDTGHILLPAGGDQVLGRSELPQIIAELNIKVDGYHFELSDYERFMAAVRGAASLEHTIQGELMASQKTRIHHTIPSQRVDIKMLNSEVENKIFYQLEPLAVMATKLGARYPRQWFDWMFKQLFDVHAHDSIGGCNSDETNEAIVHRLRRVERVADGLLNVYKKQISRGVKERIGQEPVVVFHLLPKKETKQVEVTVFSKFEDVVLIDLNGAMPEQVITQQKYLSGGKKVIVTAEGEKQVEVPGYYETQITVELDLLPFSYQSFLITEGAVVRQTESDSTEIKNEFYHLHVDNYRLNLTRYDGVQLSNFMRFEDTADAGDSYDYSPLENDMPFVTQGCEVLSSKKNPLYSELLVRHVLHTRSDLAAELRDQMMTIETTLRLRKNSDVMEIEHRFVNRTCDHRVRVCFAAPNSTTNFADQGFAAIERSNVNPRMANWQADGYAEAPVPIYPLENFAAAICDGGAVGVLTTGLKEYEVQGEAFCLTLFRGVGLLGRDDLPWRPGRASGINNKVVETPDAQMLGDHVYTYGWRFAADNEPLDWFARNEARQFAPLSYQVQGLNTFSERLDRFDLPQPAAIGSLPDQQSFLEVPETIFISACKQAEDASGPVLRVFNPSEQAVLPNIRGQAVDLTESLVNTPADIPAKGYQTYLLEGF